MPEKGTDRVAMLAKAAKTKAAIIAAINNAPGPLGLGEIVDKLAEIVEVEKTKKFYDSVRQHLTRMVENKLINKGVGENGILVYGNGKLENPEPKRKEVSTKELEVVVNGITIIISHNKQTGRPRIIIE